MVLEEIAQNILTFVNYGITVIVILIAVEVGRLVGRMFGGTKLPEPLREFGNRGIVGDARQTWDDLRQVVVGAEKSVLADFVAERAVLQKLQEAQKEINVNPTSIMGRTKLEEGKQLLNRRAKKFTSRMERYVKRLTDEGRKIRGFDVTKLDAVRNDVLAKHDTVEKSLNAALAGKNPKNNVQAAITAENDILKDLRGLLALEKELESR